MASSPGGFTGKKWENVLLDALHVMSFAIFGALTRQFVTHILGGLTPYPLFPEIGANMLGCFVMGALVSAQKVLVANSAQCVYLAVTTGFCGSFTTFSSWMLHCGKELSHGHVASAIGILVHGSFAAMASFQLGGHFVMLCDSLIDLCDRADDDSDVGSVSAPLAGPETLNYSSISPPVLNGGVGHRGSVRPASGVMTLANQPSSVSLNLMATDNSSQETRDRSKTVEIRHRGSRASQVMVPRIDSFLLTGGARAERNRSTIMLGGVVNSFYTAKDKEDPTAKKTISQRWDNAVLLVLISVVFVCSVGGLCVAVAVDANLHRTSEYWMPALFAMPGAVCRWQLTRLNKLLVLKLPLGTMIANVAAIIIASVLSGLQISEFPDAADAARITVHHALTSLVWGFCGCLSTVSSFVAELHLLPLSWGYTYGAVSLAAGVVIATVGYGSFVWT